MSLKAHNLVDILNDSEATASPPDNSSTLSCLLKDAAQSISKPSWNNCPSGGSSSLDKSTTAISSCLLKDLSSCSTEKERDTPADQGPCNGVVSAPSTDKDPTGGAGGPVACEHCDYIGNSKWHIDRHQIIHQDWRPYKCLWCGYAGKLRQYLKSHILRHHPEKIPAQDMGNKRKKRKDAVSQLDNCNLYTFGNNHLFVCQFCDFKTQESWQLKRHVKRHLDDRPFQCHKCDYAAKLKHHLKIHIDRRHPAWKDTLPVKD
eukprot:sb/3468460/